MDSKMVMSEPSEIPLASFDLTFVLDSSVGDAAAGDGGGVVISASLGVGGVGGDVVSGAFAGA